MTNRKEYGRSERKKQGAGTPSSAGILEQSMGARPRKRVGKDCRTGPPGYIGWRAGTTTRFLTAIDCSKIPENKFANF